MFEGISGEVIVSKMFYAAENSSSDVLQQVKRIYLSCALFNISTSISFEHLTYFPWKLSLVFFSILLLFKKRSDLLVHSELPFHISFIKMTNILWVSRVILCFLWCLTSPVVFWLFSFILPINFLFNVIIKYYIIFPTSAALPKLILEKNTFQYLNICCKD